MVVSAVIHILKQQPDGVACNHGLKKVVVLQFTRAYDKNEDWAVTSEDYKTSRHVSSIDMLQTMPGPTG